MSDQKSRNNWKAAEAGNSRGSAAGQGPAGAEAAPFAAPSLSLPKGGGALRGMGEKFAANPVTGTGSITVPIAISPGRGGIGPQLSLAYDSGAGNSPFGLGWNLSLPAITRKTEKGMPQYDDGYEKESDVFILSGAEDLVPVLDENGRLPVPEIRNGFQIKLYRPRIEGLFARIERWTNLSSGETRWRSITIDNHTTWYGKTTESRIYKAGRPNHVFAWLICESYDDKGNAIRYEYKPEDSTLVDTALASEKNRTDTARGANRYLKRILYCNATPRADDEDLSRRDDWLMEVVFDYGDHDPVSPAPKDDEERTPAGALIRPWPVRQDPFSTYRSGFETRTYRLCRRVLMFHHFAQEEGVGKDCLVRSTDFAYTTNHIASFITSVAQSGYKRRGTGYLKRTLPPVEFVYSQAVIQNKVEEPDAASLENLPIGLDGGGYQWVDLDGEGISGILAERDGAWFYKRNLSPINPSLKDPRQVLAKFAPVEIVPVKPNADVMDGQVQFMDLAGDGMLDLVLFEGQTPGLYEHDDADGWQPFRPFTSWLNRNTRDPNLKFVDLDGDGHADALITEDEVLTWHPSLAEEGFGPARHVRKPFDEEKGPALVFADGAQSIYLADMSGDGLTDLVRIRDGEVCYWPNLGYGRFGAKVTMDNSPRFDRPDQFDQLRIRLADIDGSGVTDILYLHGDGVRIYFNQSGNRWSDAQKLSVFPLVDNLSSVTVTDLLGNGTACLVWSSSLPGDARRQMRYVDLMGGQKPHLLIKAVNNLGAETEIQYAPSTKFYLQDKYAGRPWITRLPFPVHVVERVTTIDRISNHQFVARYQYHHGYFDGVEREFHGFGMVEQWDTDEFDKLDQAAANVDRSWHAPPVHTKTWFHTGAYLRGQEISRQLAREYFGAPADEAAFEKWLNETLLPDTIFPDGDLSVDERRQAARALKGAMLRQEIYADDAPAGASADLVNRSRIPYTVTEQNFAVERLQPQAGQRHAVFFTHPREVINYHYERELDDPRVSHALTLEIDAYGNTLKSLAIGYRRKQSPLPEERDRIKQTTTLITYTENSVTKPVLEPDDYRAPLPAATRTYELTGFSPENGAARFSLHEFTKNNFIALTSAVEIPYEQTADTNQKQKRLIEDVRRIYRRDDLTGFLAPGVLEGLALPGESYKLALTPGLLSAVFRRDSADQPPENLLPPDPGLLLEGRGADQGGYVKMEGKWWIPSGRVYFDAAANVSSPHLTAAQELAAARANFFLPQKFTDPFGQNTIVGYDDHHLLLARTQDALGNTVVAVNDYRVLQPKLVTDPNRNRAAAAFDALGMVTAAAVMGKVDEPDGQPKGDLLEDFDADPPLAALQSFMADPRNQAASLLGKATTRAVYDPDRFRRCGQPPFAAMLARETHFQDPGGAQSKIQISFSYSDGFGREIQKKIQAEAGDAPQREADVPLPSGDIRPGLLILANGQPAQANAPRRWVGAGRTVFNNKGKPVKQYEPFFSSTHLYEEEREMTENGVSPVLFYDPAERVIATLHPNHTYEKVVFDAWQQKIWDVNDTVAPKNDETGDPRTDLHIAGYVKDYFAAQPNSWQTWFAARAGGQMGAAEKDAAEKAAGHANTPTITHFDALGRAFLNVVDNGLGQNQTPQKYSTRVALDIEGNQRQVIDAKDRVVVSYDYDLLGARIHQSSMEAGERWMLNDVTGNPIRAWDSRRFIRRLNYDELRRPTKLFVTENGAERLAERTVYGESIGDAANHRARTHRVFDGAGIVTSEAYDFKGNLLRGKRELLPNYKQAVDWQLNPVANGGTSTSASRYDALNRLATVATPDKSVYRPTFNEANLLDQVEVNLRGALTSTPFVTNVNYNAKGQRVLIAFGNGAQTSYEYDPLTFRLTRILSTRPANPDVTASQLFQSPTTVQDLHYTYDPSGNITRIEDAALKMIVHDQEQVEPVCAYTYDAVYRLVEARGREHIGQMTFDFNPPNGKRRDFPFLGVRVNPNDMQAMRNYTERYEYDEVGNFEFLRHAFNGGGWNRDYDYDADSLLELGARKSNRLTKTTVGNGGLSTETYGYKDAQGADVHGCMTAINSMQMTWDFKDQLQQVDLGGGGTAYYVYNAGGQRVRKVIETQNGIRKEERIYLGGYEIYREYNGGGVNVTLERETLHVMDDKQRVALVETRVSGNEPGLPQQLIRYQLGNHLGSASLELDDQAQIISYEEFTPYGNASYQAVRSQIETPKRYRYTSKERDEETGFQYHGARYLILWLGRWLSADPLGIIGGLNLFAYVNCAPTRRWDPDGTNDSDVGAVVDEAIGRLDQPGNPFQQQGKVGLQRTAITMDIDEPNAVGDRGISAADARARATDVNNRQFLDPRTNRATKHLGASTDPQAPARPPVSVADDPDALLNRRFSEITEMRDVFNEASSKIRNPASLKPTDLKNRINSYIWDVIKNSNSSSAVKVRAALAKLGFENVKGQGYVLKAASATNQAATTPKAADPAPTPKPAADPAPKPTVDPAPKTTGVGKGILIFIEKGVVVVQMGQANSHEEAAQEYAKIMVAGIIVRIIGPRGVALAAASAAGGYVLYKYQDAIGRAIDEGLSRDDTDPAKLRREKPKLFWDYVFGN
jgi:RHS repeat-associated protein